MAEVTAIARAPAKRSIRAAGRRWRFCWSAPFSLRSISSSSMSRMPAMAAGLKACAAEMQLVISGYAVVYAVFLITGGRLGDIFGRKAVFMLGLAGFALASVICGLAGSPTSLIAGRLLQALAAAPWRRRRSPRSMRCFLRTSAAGR